MAETWRAPLYTPVAPRASLLRRARSAIRIRMRGPGGFYNAGDLLILFTGISLQVHAALTAGDGVTGAILAYFFGSPEATLLGISMTTFLVGGELYHRAWADPAALDHRLIRLGDLVCGIATGIFTIALVRVGNPSLALLGGIGMTAARLGLATLPVHLCSVSLRRWLRRLIVLCRMPQLLSITIALWTITAAGSTAVGYLAPVSVLFGILLSLRADLMFSPTLSQPLPAPACSVALADASAPVGLN